MGIHILFLDPGSRGDCRSFFSDIPLIIMKLDIKLTSSWGLQKFQENSKSRQMQKQN